MLWNLIFIITGILVLISIIILIKQRKYINFKSIFIFIIILAVLSIPDIFTTFLFVSKAGIIMEGNITARWFMYNFGLIKGLIFHRVFFAIPLLFFLSIIPNYLENKTKIPYFKLLAGIMIMAGILIPFWNLFA